MSEPHSFDLSRFNAITPYLAQEDTAKYVRSEGMAPNPIVLGTTEDQSVLVQLGQHIHDPGLPEALKSPETPDEWVFKFETEMQSLDAEFAAEGTGEEDSADNLFFVAPTILDRCKKYGPRVARLIEQQIKVLKRHPSPHKVREIYTVLNASAVFAANLPHGELRSVFDRLQKLAFKIGMSPLESAVPTEPVGSLEPLQEMAEESDGHDDPPTAAV